MSGDCAGDGERCLGCKGCYLALGVGLYSDNCPDCKGTGCVNDEHRGRE